MGRDVHSEALEPTFEGIRLQDILTPRAQIALTKISRKCNQPSDSIDAAEAINQAKDTISEHHVKRFTSSDDDEVERKLEGALETIGPLDISELISDDENSAIPPQAQEVLRWLEEKPDDSLFQEGSFDSISDNLRVGEAERLASLTGNAAQDEDVNDEQVRTAYRDAMRVLRSVIEETGEENGTSKKILILVFLAVVAANVHLPGVTGSVITALAVVNEAKTLSINDDGDPDM